MLSFSRLGHSAFSLNLILSSLSNSFLNTNKRYIAFGSKTVKVTFKNVTGYASYKVQMKAGKAAYKTVKTTTKGGTITYTKKKAKVGTTYKFCLKGINKVNGKTVSVTIK